MINNNPIGLFDSGIGGTSIWKEIHDLLPNENTIYLADSKNAPYGQKSKEEIVQLSIKNTEFLLNQNCKIIVVACNTATTNAIKELRAKYDVPFIGIEPAIKPAALNSSTNTIGILATKGTLNSELFHQTLEKFQETKIIEQIGHGLVTLIENGELNSIETKNLLKTYLKPMIEANIDYLVLGCSHYPYLIPQIKKIIPTKIKIIDSGEAVARQTKNVLVEKSILNLENKLGKAVFYTNANPKVLENILKNKEEVIQKDF
ncbi:MAG TPA: glutamate racemase [Flavobacterium sp.]|jgi:glutamate racemase|uniref:glutamate racemase n=1 Tax=Flavobacterium sp. TaxID=239 RepID=UPI002C537E34|nr:glutamate racemase [Bacteroidota bacterium]HPW97969.1 glutamate racemase [Flavobacterium sp.]